MCDFSSHSLKLKHLSRLWSLKSIANSLLLFGAGPYIHTPWVTDKWAYSQELRQLQDVLQSQETHAFPRLEMSVMGLLRMTIVLNAPRSLSTDTWPSGAVHLRCFPVAVLARTTPFPVCPTPFSSSLTYSIKGNNLVLLSICCVPGSFACSWGSLDSP